MLKELQGYRLQRLYDYKNLEMLHEGSIRDMRVFSSLRGLFRVRGV